ncbi:ABC transporter integral membrane type 1 [Penicillium samsonianum]|uniref:ABC transporter integral membrane type 1 n=1 Tax=Penicillium samsonianum TaxID=1882272 RepID=UPI002547A9EF|nr:ABC transporter integral membrane type 1 [Penicillium samsonianum]KAJ6138200.1 ABC transporter integral membrane type 1 [Penicillium samsonianum]
MLPKRKTSDQNDTSKENIPEGNPGWKSLFGFTTRRHLPTLIFGCIFALVASCVTPALAIFLGNVFDSFTSFGADHTDAKGLHSQVITSCFGMIGLGVAGWFLNGAYYALFVAFGEMQASVIRSQVFLELLNRDVEWFEAKSEGSGALLSGIQAHIHEMQMATSQPLGLVLQYSCRSLASLGLGLYTSWSLSLVTLAGIPIFSAIIGFLSSKMKFSITAQQAELTEASKVANNAITNIDTVKCLNGQALEHRNFSERIERSATHYLRQARLNSLQIAVTRWMMFGMFVQGFWYGSSLARAGKLTSGEVLRTFWACLTAAQSIEQVLPQMIVMEKGKVAGVALRSIIQSRREDKIVSEVKGTRYPEHCEGDIEVKNVSFSYPSQPDQCVLKPSSFFFPAGETTFVIGKSGSGKSTLSQLLMRFYLPNSGEILIDRNPMQELDINWIRNNITLLEQNSVLFNESVLTNIAFGRQDHATVTKQDVKDPIELAMLENTIDGLPQGINTCVGPGGSFLSGGQRQRVAIARAKLRDTPILILDEPTSALDHTNRVAVMKAIREWRKGKTTVIITHDMSQIMEQDFLYILEQGSIVKSGYRFAVEVSPGSEKYFHTKVDLHLETKPQNKRAVDDMEIPWESSSSDSLDTLRPPTAFLGHRRSRTSWAQGHIPPTFRSGSLDLTSRKNSEYVVRNGEFPGSPLQDLSQRLSLMTEGYVPKWDSKETTIQIPAEEVKMVHIDDQGLKSDTWPNGHTTKDPSETKRSRRLHGRRKKSNEQHILKERMTPLSQIMGTILSALTIRLRIILFLGFAAALAHASATPIFSYCLSQLFGTFYAGSNSEHLTMTWSLAVLGVSFGDGLASFFMHYFLELCGEAWMDSFRKNAFQRILDQPRAWFEKDGNGSLRLTSSLDQNGEDMRNLLGRFAGFVVVAAAITVMAIIWSLIVCWKLTLVALSCGPVIYVITRGFEGTNGLWERRCNDANNIAADVFTETFSEIRTVRTLTLEGHFHRKQANAIARCLLLGLKRAIYTGMLFGMVESTVIFSTALIFYYGAVLAASREFNVDDVMMVFSMLLFSIGYAAQILSWIPQINTSREIATQLIRLAKLPQDGSHEHRGSLTVSKLTPIKLTNVNFRYPSRPNTRVLKNVSISIPRNSCTALVGRSGSGKSTIASLLLSVYEAPASETGQPTVTLGGADILRLHVPTLRSQISIVSQQPTIFPGTIHENISYGLDQHSPLASSHSVRTAAQGAGIDDFISSLPRGYNTVIGDGGVGLSGGQKQRVVIARALLRQPQILILDEATSSLDPAGAEIVRQTVQQLVAVRQGLTVIIITHSKEMIEIANHVVVLDQGAVVEDGPYQALAKMNGGKLHALLSDPEEVDA